VGAEKDAKRLEDTFGHFLGFEVHVATDLTKRQMLEALEGARKKINANPDKYKCLVVCILSHGEDRKVFPLDLKLHFDVDDLPKIFSNTECQALRNKPKLFIVVACRGQGTNTSILNGRTTMADGPRRVLILSLLSIELAHATCVLDRRTA